MYRCLAALVFSAVVVVGEVQIWDGYPPPPQPVTGNVALTAYIFPGWYRDVGKGDYPYHTHDEESEWRLIAAKPEPRPLLGFYDDSRPEVNDWHITWALEHGISTFVFDWYWNAGEHRLLRTLEQGFLNARYASLMRFCIHWCNHPLDWQTRQWYPLMGLEQSAIADGQLKARVVSGDPAFACPVQIDAARFTHALVRLQLDQGTRAQLFWGGPMNRESEANSISFETIPDGRFHEYLLDLRAVEGWQGRISRLRFDPNSGCPDSAMALDCIRLLQSDNPEGPGLAWDFDRDVPLDDLAGGGLDLSEPALVQMVDYMAEHYFSRSNYLTIGERPVVVVWDPRAVIRAHAGPEGFRRVLATMNTVLHQRGMEDLYLVSMVGGEDIQAAGFNAVTGYGYYGVDFDAPWEWRRGYSVPYGMVVDHYRSMWRSVSRSLQLPYIVPIGSNWDDRPRAGESAAVITGKTPELFREMCRRSLDVIQPPLNMAIVEAWNEWGEGSFVEPDQEWGFAFLDVLRDVFTDAPAEHVDRVPTAAKIAEFSVLSVNEVEAARQLEGTAYPDPPRSPRSVRWRVDEPLPLSVPLKQWEFNGSSMEGWVTHQLDNVSVQDGILSALVTGVDPQLIVDNVQIDIDALGVLALRLRVSEGVTSCQIYWSTDADPLPSADKSFLFPLRPDGVWHTYQVAKELDATWQGRLKMLRFDTGGSADRIDLDWVRLLGHSPAE